MIGVLFCFQIVIPDKPNRPAGHSGQKEAPGAEESLAALLNQHDQKEPPWSDSPNHSRPIANQQTNHKIWGSLKSKSQTPTLHFLVFINKYIYVSIDFEQVRAWWLVEVIWACHKSLYLRYSIRQAESSDMLAHLRHSLVIYVQTN
jgi:hypothetical protein